MATPPPTQIGPYRILRPLGQGGMGTVYEAIQEPIERRVALKVLLPQHAQNADTLSRFFNEARAVNLIEHPSIVQVSDYGQTPDGTAYLVMECLRGETLSSRLDRLLAANQRLPWVEAAQIAAQMADALTAAHGKSIVHRDLKPGNVMLVRDPVAPSGERAKILDFGIAKLTQGQAHGTATNALIGTPQYMSPEQCRGAGGVDDKTDVYALGIILYEILAGRPPFLGDNTVEYLGQHAFKEPPSLYDFAPRAHPPLVTLIHRLLVKDKAQRPAMREVGIELTRLTASASGARPATPAPAEDSDETRVAVSVMPPLSTLSGSLGQTATRVPHHRLKIVGAAVATMVAAALGTLLFWHPAKQPPATVTPSSAPLPASAGPAPAPAPVALSPSAAPPAAAPPATDPLPAAAAPAPAPPDPAPTRPATVPRATVPVPTSDPPKPSRPHPKATLELEDPPHAKPATGSSPASKPAKPAPPLAKRPIRHEN